MYRVKYYDTIEPQTFEETFDTLEEAHTWIEAQMCIWRDVLCEEYPEADITWLNRFLDCGNTTTIYVPNTSIEIVCTLIKI